MEHWAHRLFPKMPFDEVIERVEKLGSKKEVQTCVKKIRLDIPILDNDFVGSDQEEQDVQPGNDKDESEENVRAEDMWDELLREEEEITGSQSGPSTSRAVSGSQPEPSLSKSPESGNRGYNTPVTPAQIAVASPGGFTPEQLDRIEKNKQMALEKRLKKMGHLTPKPKPVLPGSQTPTGSGNLQAQSSLGSPAPAKVDTRDGSRSPLKSVSQENPVKVKPKATDDSDKEQEKSSITLRGGFAMTDSGDELNTDTSQTGTLNTVTSQSEGTMSQVYDKSTSQNVTIVDKFAKNAQHWNSASAGGSDSGLLLGSSDTEISGDIADNTGEQDIDETSDNPMSKTKEFVYSAVKATESSGDCSSTSKETIENIDAKKPLSDGGEEMSENLKTEEMSEIIQNQDWKNQKKLGCETGENSSMDTDEMSEVIEKQGSVNVVLKDKCNLGNEDQHVNDKISKDSGKHIEKDNIKQVLKLDVNDHQEKENLNINKVKEMAKNVIVNCKTDMTGDHVDLNDIDFDDELDDELNEEQLMETIDSQ